MLCTLFRRSILEIMTLDLKSSRLTERDEAQAVRSMAYEDLVPSNLEEAHRRMLQEYYGAKYQMS